MWQSKGKQSELPALFRTPNLKMRYQKRTFLAALLLRRLSSSSSSSSSVVGLDLDNDDDDDDDFFPPLIEPDDVAHFFSTYDLDGLHWALTNVFQRRSARIPQNRNSERRRGQLPSEITSRGGGNAYTSEYKLRHDLEQARYLAKVLVPVADETTTDAPLPTVEYFVNSVIPIYEHVLRDIPPLSELTSTKGLYAFTKENYDSGIASVYNQALYMTTSSKIDSGWNERINLNENLDWDTIQKDWFVVSDITQTDDLDTTSTLDTNVTGGGVIVIDEIFTPDTLSILRTLLLQNTHWFQTKTPLEFGTYVGAYIDDGLHDPIFLEIAKELHLAMPLIMQNHSLRYMWAYKYDSEWDSGINLHADMAAVNVNIWLSLDGADLKEEGYGGGIVIYTARPPLHWSFESYNTDTTNRVVDKLLRPMNFANITIKHRPNRAVIFDSALFHQSDRYRFRNGYENGRINLTFLFGDMQKRSEDGECSDTTIAEKFTP